KFTKNGTIRLDAQREAAPEGDWILFRISDNGIGMTAEQVGRLFQAFTQADASTTRKFGGTGLGLAITRRICQRVGGHVPVESERGRGSPFTIRAPAALDGPASGQFTPTSAAAPPAPAVPPAGKPADDGLPSVLVIDDDPQIHDLTSRFLAGDGFV